MSSSCYRNLLLIEFVLNSSLIKCCIIASLKRVFESVVAVAFQIAFRAEKHANNVFSFFKNYF